MILHSCTLLYVTTEGLEHKKRMNWRSCIKTGTLDQLLLLFLKFSQMDLRCWTKSWFSNLLGIDHRGATRRPERSELNSVSLEGWVMATLGTNLLELEFVATCLTIQVLRCCSVLSYGKAIGNWRSMTLRSASELGT